MITFAKRETKLNDMMSSFNRPPVPPVAPRDSRPTGGNQNKPINQPVKEDNFDIDALVKRIDAKIAELEEQEKQEQLAKAQGKADIKENKADSQDSNSQIIEDSKTSTDVQPISTSTENKVVEEPKIVLKEEENKVINGVTDDQFFDDFFNDED